MCFGATFLELFGSAHISHGHRAADCRAASKQRRGAAVLVAGADPLSNPLATSKQTAPKEADSNQQGN